MRQGLTRDLKRIGKKMDDIWTKIGGPDIEEIQTIPAQAVLRSIMCFPMTRKRKLKTRFKSRPMQRILLTQSRIRINNPTISQPIRPSLRRMLRSPLMHR